MSPEPAPDEVAPLLVLGLGNRLLTDDGLGLELLERVRPRLAGDARVELCDGGTQGLALLPRLAGRRALLVLDAVGLGAAPGAVHHLRDADEVHAHRSGGAHEGNAGELLATAALIGDLPATVEVVGIEPAEVRTGIGLSGPARAALGPAAERALATAERLLGALEPRGTACTS